LHTVRSYLGGYDNRLPVAITERISQEIGQYPAQGQGGRQLGKFTGTVFRQQLGCLVAPQTGEERMATKAAEGRPMWGAASAPAFKDIDTNGDGSLTPEELTTGQQSHMRQRGGMGR